MGVDIINPLDSIYQRKVVTPSSIWATFLTPHSEMSVQRSQGPEATRRVLAQTDMIVALQFTPWYRISPMRTGWTHSPLSVLTIDGSIAYKEYEDMIATKSTCHQHMVF